MKYISPLIRPSIFITFVVALLLPPMLRSDPYEIITRVEEAEPFTFKKDGQWVGLNIDLYRALLAETEYTAVRSHWPWSRAFRNMRSGKLHIIAFLTPSKERDEYMHFIGPHAVEEMSVFINKKYQKLPLDSFDSMIVNCNKTGLTYGLQQDYFVSNEFKNRYDNDESLRRCISNIVGTINGLKLVNNGRLMGIIESRIAAGYNITFNQDKYKNVVYSGFSIVKTDVYFGLSKKLPDEVVNTLSAANQILIKNGTYEKILQKWR